MRERIFFFTPADTISGVDNAHFVLKSAPKDLKKRSFFRFSWFKYVVKFTARWHVDLLSDFRPKHWGQQKKKFQLLIVDLSCNWVLKWVSDVEKFFRFTSPFEGSYFNIIFQFLFTSFINIFMWTAFYIDRWNNKEKTS